MRPRSSRQAATRPRCELLESRELLAGNLGHHLVEARSTPQHSQMSNLVYTIDGSGPQRLDVHLPSGQAPVGGWPVVLAIHGGGWLSGDKVSYEAKVDPTLLAAGFAVVAPDYTLSKPGHPSWPINLDELRQAVRWVKTDAARFDFNPSQIAAMGESAGGHLALMLGTDPAGAQTQVKAVVDFYGPTDLAALEHESSNAAPAVRQLLGGLPAQFPARYASASPVTHVSPASPPVLIAQGTDDQVVTPSQSSEIAQVLTSVGVPNQLITVSGAPHGFGLEVNGIDLGPSVVGFLRQTLGG